MSAPNPTDPIASGEQTVPVIRRLLMSPAVTLGVAVAVFVLFGLTQSVQFGSLLSWVNILRDATLIAVPAAFSCLVLVSGGLDLSIGSVLAAGAMTSSAIAASGLGPVLAFAGGTAVGATVGLVNGLLINFGRIPPFITTLGALFAVQAAVVAVSGGNPIGPLPDSFTAWGQGSVGGMPTLILVGLAVLAAAHILLSSTNYGWAVRAIGGNTAAARSAGIAVTRTSVSVYVLSGAASAFTGAILAAEIGSGSPTFGTGYELQAIAAAVIGGTSIYGAIGSVPGAALGALMLAVLANGLVFLRVDPNWQNLIVGLVLVAAAGLDVIRRGQMFRLSARRTAASRRIN